MSKFQRLLLATALFASVVGACGCATCDSTSREPPPFVAESRRFRTSAELDADLVYSPNDGESVVVVGVSFRAAER